MSLSARSSERDDRAKPNRASDGYQTTLVPARLERLPWSSFHWLVIVALGVTWILDGLEVTLAGSVGASLQSSPSLHLNDFDVGLAGAVYVFGAVTGAIGFGWLTDRLGRKKLFFVTLGVYLTATALTGLSWDKTSFLVFRFLTGCGIGGEYSAINSAIQEVVPARFRGRVDLAVNGSFWVGAAVGAFATLALVDPNRFGADLGWRFAFLTGAALGLAILPMRRWVPESPRWLATHGRTQEADKVVDEIEHRIEAHGYRLDKVDPTKASRFKPRASTPLSDVFHALFVRYRLRTCVGLVLMAAQAFFYNSIFFTYALVLTKFYQVDASKVGWYILPFALGNFMGPMLLGPLFDSLGRRVMVAATYGIAGLGLIACAALFLSGSLTAATQTIGWTVVFFFASPAASAAYLTVSETFPLEVRAIAIAIFYSIGTGIGGVAGPLLFGWLIQSGSRESVCIGYGLAAALMLIAAALAAKFVTPAERKPLEEVATPLSAA